MPFYRNWCLGNKLSCSASQTPTGSILTQAQYQVAGLRTNCAQQQSSTSETEKSVFFFPANPAASNLPQGQTHTSMTQQDGLSHLSPFKHHLSSASE